MINETLLKVVVDDVLGQIQSQRRQQEVMQSCINSAKLEIESVNYLEDFLEENAVTGIVMNRIVREQTKAIPEYEGSQEKAKERETENIIALSSLQKICPHTNNTVWHIDPPYEYIRCDLCTFESRRETPVVDETFDPDSGVA